MSWIAVGVGAATVITGAVMQSNAASSAAKAQRREAEKQRAAILAQSKENQDKAMALAQATPQELAVLTRANQSAVSSLDREEKMLAAIDPVVMEASQQALKLLRGESAGTTQALMNQRNTQRQALLNSLRAQYGPAADTSSIGQRALQQFDMETNTMMTQANSNAFNQVFGTATADVGGRARMANSQLQQVGQGWSELQNRVLNTQLNTGNAALAALSGTSASMIQSAGYRSVGGQILGSGISSVGSGILGAGMQGAGKQSVTGKPTQQPNYNGLGDTTGDGFAGTFDPNKYGSMA